MQTILLSAGVGALIGVIVESAIRPRISRRSLAELLAADLSMHAQSIVSALLQIRDHPKSVPVYKPLSLQVFSIAQPRLGELPSSLLGEVLVTYGILNRVNELSEKAGELYRSMRTADAKSEAFGFYESELKTALALYSRFLEESVARMKAVQPKRIRLARPWWSIRFFGVPKPKALDANEMSAELAELAQDTARRIESIQ